jgi:hypothetical protein
MIYSTNEFGLKKPKHHITYRMTLKDTKNKAKSVNENRTLTKTVLFQLTTLLQEFLFSSPEWKVHGELLVSKGSTPASVVMHQKSSSSFLKAMGRFTSNVFCSILVTVTLNLLMPFKWSL